MLVFNSFLSLWLISTSSFFSPLIDCFFLSSLHFPYECFYHYYWLSNRYFQFREFAFAHHRCGSQPSLTHKIITGPLITQILTKKGCNSASESQIMSHTGAQKDGAPCHLHRNWVSCAPKEAVILADILIRIAHWWLSVICRQARADRRQTGAHDTGIMCESNDAHIAGDKSRILSYFFFLADDAPSLVTIDWILFPLDTSTFFSGDILSIFCYFFGGPPLMMMIRKWTCKGPHDLCICLMFFIGIFLLTKSGTDRYRIDAWIKSVSCSQLVDHHDLTNGKLCVLASPSRIDILSCLTFLRSTFDDHEDLFLRIISFYHVWAEAACAASSFKMKLPSSPPPIMTAWTSWIPMLIKQLTLTHFKLTKYKGPLILSLEWVAHIGPSNLLLIFLWLRKDKTKQNKKTPVISPTLLLIVTYYNLLLRPFIQYNSSSSPIEIELNSRGTIRFRINFWLPFPLQFVPDLDDDEDLIVQPFSLHFHSQGCLDQRSECRGGLPSQTVTNPWRAFSSICFGSAKLQRGLFSLFDNIGGTLTRVSSSGALFVLPRETKGKNALILILECKHSYLFIISNSPPLLSFTNTRNLFSPPILATYLNSDSASLLSFRPLRRHLTGPHHHPLDTVRLTGRPPKPLTHRLHEPTIKFSNFIHSRIYIPRYVSPFSSAEIGYYRPSNNTICLCKLHHHPHPLVSSSLNRCPFQTDWFTIAFRHRPTFASPLEAIILFYPDPHPQLSLSLIDSLKRIPKQCASLRGFGISFFLVTLSPNATIFSTPSTISTHRYSRNRKPVISHFKNLVACYNLRPIRQRTSSRSPTINSY
ncbi:putative signal peptide protein [Puccinia sorghi]|uniref:Putative signal peptide protein n=1 Tax=Puccinia sorghi TaxID=27349 RepID=A0A0L6VM47_9BASI|nr:putative signal peptide protein [Puccinia sorghi]